MVFLIAVSVILLPILVGGLLAFVAARADTAVTETKEELEEKEKSVNPGLTLGHPIPVTADFETQFREARKLAAKKAAMLPRGANMRIRPGFNSAAHTASKALNEDPLTAVKIAMFHGWDGARTGPVAVGAAPAVAAPARGAAPAKAGKIELVPGKDYPVIEITDDMTPEEKRKARIANAKAKSAAMKAAKAAGATAAPAAAAPAPVAAPAAPAAAVSVNIEPPQLIEITDDMTPEEKRKARIQNSKAKSAFNKALKAAGIDPKSVKIENGQVVLPAGAGAAAAPQPAPAPEPVAEAAAAPAAAPTAIDPAALNIPEPQLIEITDDMSPEEVRKARVHNAKERARYNKALKAAGIDPKSLKS
ncbi:MAG: hypothetical protein D6706_04395 [Chloroflexi bacterium]|nr:MAG: hypothetical protein D6706_04395 [Chloroflexota bacterium]